MGGSNNEAQALALLWGLRLVRKHGVIRLTVEGGSMLIIKVVKGVTESFWEIMVIVEEICKMMEEY